jgi:two-component system sensor histidine kinase KdpD
MAARATSASPSPGAPSSFGSLAAALLVGAVVVVVETAISWFLLDHRLPDVVMVYLLGVVVTATRFGYAPSLITAVLGVAAFDFFFAAPYFSFSVEDKRYLLTFFIMLFVALVISNRTQRIRRDATAAGDREARTARLYAMSRELSISPSSREILDVALRHIRDAFASDVVVLLPADGGGLVRANTTAEPAFDLDIHVMSRANDLFTKGRPVPGAGYVLGTGERILLLGASTGTLGLLVVRPSAPPDHFASQSNLELLEAFANLIALAIERGQLAENAQRAQLEVQKERLRNALLSSVSHDLRTPLAVVKGAVTALLEQGDALTAARRYEYLETISGEASRLNRLVRNLLNMTSLEAGAMRARKEWQPLEEVVGVALNRLEEQLADRPVEIRIAPDASLVPYDATLLEQVLLNLVENALKYSPPHSAIEIRARSVQDGVEVEVADHGPGVSPGQEETIFEKFHRAPPNSNVAGMGLGLTICRGIVSVHGGRIWCERRNGGGASFRFVLPREGEAPALHVLPEAVGDP